ncbi:MAG: hypothetical protein ABIO04_08170 [Ferruginibacter sp.]
MILSRISPVALFTTVMFFLCSCNGNDKTTETDKMSTDTLNTTTTSTIESAPASTIVTTPQAMLLVRHKVANFSKWMTSYDGHDSMRVASGMHNYVIGRGVKDSNMVFVAVKADDTERAKTFSKDPSLKKAMQQGGVIGAPSVSMVMVMYMDSAANSATRALTTFMVKDWDTWTKAFEQGKQERIDNGISVRAYGHEVGNNNKVTLVTAINDSAKAVAYWNSDMLKKRREASGVMSTPDRFVYRVVKRY